MQNTDAFTAQQALAYRQGRKAWKLGIKAYAYPYTTGSAKAEAWINGWRDASQGIGANGLQSR